MIRSEPLSSIRPERERVHIIDTLAPNWARRAAVQLAALDATWRAVSVGLSLLCFVIGLGLLIGGGYTSIQGVRIPLKLAGLSVTTTGFPALTWWLIPLGNTFIQIVCRHVAPLRVLWRPSIAYDGTTNALFLSIGALNILGSVAYSHIATSVVTIPVYPIVIFLCAFGGLILAVVAEHLVLGALCIFRAVR